MVRIHTEKIIDYWVKNSDKKWKTAQHLLETKDYVDALFFCHLTIECLLKAAYVQNLKKPASFSHDLVKIAQDAKLSLDKKTEKELDRLSTFNISARYPDEKFEIFKSVTKTITREWINKTKNYRVWLKSHLKEKKGFQK